MRYHQSQLHRVVRQKEAELRRSIICLKRLALMLLADMYFNWNILPSMRSVWTSMFCCLRKLLGQGLGSCSVEELEEVESQLERSLRNIRARKVCNQQIELPFSMSCLSNKIWEYKDHAFVIYLLIYIHIAFTFCFLFIFCKKKINK